MFVKPREYCFSIPCGLHHCCLGYKLIGDVGEFTLAKPRVGFNGFKLPEVAKLKEASMDV